MQSLNYIIVLSYIFYCSGKSIKKDYPYFVSHISDSDLQSSTHAPMQQMDSITEATFGQPIEDFVWFDDGYNEYKYSTFYLFVLGLKYHCPRKKNKKNLKLLKHQPVQKLTFFSGLKHIVYLLKGKNRKI